MASPYAIPSIQRQLSHPIKLLARIIYFLISSLRTSGFQPKLNITLVCISDTHCQIPPADTIPPGDILIHAGDLTNAGTLAELQAQLDWLASLPHKHKVVIAGNHDTWLDPVSRETLSGKEREGELDWKGIRYLEGTACEVEFPHRTGSIKGGKNRKVKIFGSPYTPDKLGAEHAFQYVRGEDAWSGRVPDDADVVVTHGPPRYHLDLPGVKAMGDEFLLKEIRRVKPLVHVFGHIHAGKSDVLGVLGGGQEVVRWDSTERHFEGAVRSGRPMGVLFDWMFRLIQLFLLLARGFVEIVADYSVWDREVKSTRMVNAAMVYCDSGKIGNRAQMVHL